MSLEDLERLSDDESERSRERILKPPFSYHGSKSRSANIIIQYLPVRDAYIEPFGGSAAILLAREESKLEVFNDRHAGVVDFYRCLRDPLLYNQLIDMLELMPHSREEFLESKATWKNSADPVERASKWYYMMQYSFSAHGRNWGRAIKASAPFAGRIAKKLELFPLIHSRFQKVQIENMDWEQVCMDYDNRKVVHYLDPPYYGVYDAYEYSFDEKDHIRLLRRVFKLKGFVAVSGYPNALYDRFPWSNRIEWQVLSTARAQSFDKNNAKDSDNRKHRDHVTEVLWIKEED